jgi:hypothetical protein
MYKHVALLNVVLSIETEEALSAEELEELIHSLDYEFSSDYAKCSTIIEDTHFTSTNRKTK